MLASLCLIASLVLPLQSAAGNGLRIHELAATGTFELLVGYRAGLRDEPPGRNGLAAAAASFLFSTPSVRQMAMAAHAAGGDLEYIAELDRTAVRLKVPKWAAPMIEGLAVRFFEETPEQHPELLSRALLAARAEAAAPSADDFQARVEDEIRSALVGEHPYAHRLAGRPSDLARLAPEDLSTFFSQNFGTDRGFIAMTGPAPSGIVDVPPRASVSSQAATRPSLAADRLLQFAADSDRGAVIYAVAVPSVHYDDWYAVLMVDRLIHRLVPGAVTALVPAIESFYYRVEMPVPAGETAQAIEAALVQDIERMQYVRASDEDLEIVRAEALDYLASEPIERWFLSLGISDVRQEGMDWVRSFSADRLRAAVRDLFIRNRVRASWSPRPQRVAIVVENIGEPQTAATADEAEEVALPELGRIEVSEFPPHTDPEGAGAIPVSLASGVAIVEGARHAVFVAPDSLTALGALPTAADLQRFAPYNPSRILVISPASDLEAVRSVWNGFQGDPQAAPAPLPQGFVTSGDLPALHLLKTLLERKLIEYGLWGSVRLRLISDQGEALSIDGTPEDRARVQAWIREIAEAGVPADDMNWVREAAIHRLREDGPALQGLIWHRDPQARIPDLRFIATGHVQDVARIYFR